MKYPFEKQKDLKDCGVCCLLMLVRYYGGGISKEYLRDITNTDRSGVNAYDLIEGAKKIGFDSYGVNGNILDIDDKCLPCIAHVIYKKNLQHFIVIYKIDQKKKILLVADPNNNHITKMNISDFKKISTNNFILLKPLKKIIYVEKNTELKDLISNYINKNIKIILSVILLSILITVINILCSFQFKILLEYVINYHTLNNLFLLTLIFFTLLLIKDISNFRRNRLINHINHDLDKSLFLNVYNHILSLPYLYYKNRTTGEVVSRMNDLVNIRDIISKFIVTCFIDLFLMLGAIIVLSLICFKLTIISLIVIIILLFFIFIFNKPLDDKITKSKEDNANVSSYLVETINGIETIKNQDIVSYTKRNFIFKYLKYNHNSLKYNNLFIDLDFLKNLVINIGDLLILIIGTYLIIEGIIDIATLITFITLNNYIFNPIENFINLSLSLKEAKISFERIKELYEVKEEKDNSKLVNHLDGNIYTNNLTYSYNNRNNTLNNINININKGERVLIYGKSGSGKSTLAKLLAGILKANNNNLYYDNIDINRYKLSNIRKDICYIGNTETIFTDSIYNNILLDKEEDNSFSNITKLCLVDEFVSDKDLAYDTYLEENGFNLSSGQKQRITLARSLLKNSNIYILDEALNQVDIDKERKILINIFNKYKDKTFIYISHRFNNSDLFSKKYKIENGVSYEESI